MQDVTFLIKTFEREDCLRRLVASIKRFYESARILVVDDSRKPTRLSGVDTLVLPYDVGLSVGRNAGLETIDTPYFVLLDDDYEFTSMTRIGLLLSAARRHDLDIVGGSYHGWPTSAWEVFERKNDLLYFSPNRYLRGTISPFLVRCDWTINFFLARTDKIREIGGWEPKLKLMEHAEFFVNTIGKAKIASLPFVQLVHHANKKLNSETYREMRFRTEYNQLRDRMILDYYGFRTRRISPQRGRFAPLRVFVHHLRHGSKGMDIGFSTPVVRPPLRIPSPESAPTALAR